MVAFALAIVGATKASDSDASDRSTGATLRKVGGVIILACFIFMAFVHVLLWTYKSRLYTRHRTVRSRPRSETITQKLKFHPVK